MPRLRVLHLAERAVDGERVRDLLAAADAHLVTAPSLDHVPENADFDVILVHAADAGGAEAAERARRRWGSRPVLLLSNAESGPLARHALRAGLADYVCLDDGEELADRVARAARSGPPVLPEEVDRRFREVVDRTPDGALVLGPDGELHHANERGRAWYAAAAEELQAATRGVPMHIQPVTAELPGLGRRWAEVRPVPLPWRPPGWHFVVVRDVTEQVRAARRTEALNRVLEAARRVHHAIARAPDEQAVLEAACRVLHDVLGARCAWAGLGPAAGRPAVVAAAGLAAADREHVAALVARGEWPGCARAAIEAGRPISKARPEDCAPCVLPPGEAGRHSVLAMPLTVGASPLGALVVALPPPAVDRHAEIDLFGELAADVALAVHLRRAERERDRIRRELESARDQLAMAQRLEAVGRLAGGVAHDFNNALTVIRGCAEALFEDTAGEQREDARTILDACESAARLTRQLLAFSRRQVLRPRNIDLNDVVRRMEPLLRRLLGEDVEVVLELASELPAVRADPGQLEQVLLNLAANARDAMPEGGRLLVETRAMHLGTDVVRRHPFVRQGIYAMLAVTDTGVGMDAEARARCFEPFFTTKGPGRGTGLGLATVYGTIKQSGGFIWLYSEPGQGTTFKIFLPLAEGEADRPRVAGAEGAGEVRGAGEVVLVVEDDPRVRATMTRVLVRAGYRVEIASGFEEARAVLHRLDHLDLLLTDVVLRGASGRRVAEVTAERFPDAAVLFASGYTDNAILHRGILEPGIRLLEKPFTRASLLRAVREAIEARRGG